MSVFQVVFEDTDTDGKVKEIVEYVEATKLIHVATKMDRKAEELQLDLKSIRYILSVVEKIEQEAK